MALTTSEEHEVDLIGSGYLHPLEGFMNSSDYASVLAHSLLASGELFYTPMILKARSEWIEDLRIGDCVLLLDVYSNPVGKVTVGDLWRPTGGSADVMIGGRLEYTRRRSLDAVDLRAELKRRERKKLIFFQSQFPPSNVRIEKLIKIGKDTDSVIVLQMIVGQSKWKLISDHTLRIIYRKLEFMLRRKGIDVLLTELPLPERERLFELHFLQMKVAAGMGATKILIHCDGNPAYFNTLENLSQQLGVQVRFWIEPKENLDALKNIVSDGNFDFMDRIPNYQFARILRDAYPPLHQRGLVVMFVGLSGSGKTTHAKALSGVLLRRKITMLDGDAMRAAFSPDLGYDISDRWIHVRRMKFIATEIARHGGTVIVSTVAPIRAMRNEFKEAITSVARSNFLLVHVATSLSDCKTRDPKGLYARLVNENVPLPGLAARFEGTVDEDQCLRVDGSGGVIELRSNVSKIAKELEKRRYVDPRELYFDLHEL
jgi:sulfate adenylyltransferase